MIRRTPLILVSLAAAALVLHLAGIDRVPVYLHEAEVLFGLHAHAIATTGRDIYGRWMPVYFQMQPIGENAWFQPALVYCTALVLQVLPFSEAAIRVPSAIVGMADILLVFVIARRLFDNEGLALLSAVLLLLTPAHVIHSRMAMDYLYPVPFVLGWLLCVLIFLERGRVSSVFFATTLLGFGMYSYIASLIMMPLYLAMTWALLWTSGRRSVRPYVISVAGFIWPLAFMAVWWLTHPATVGETLDRYQLGNIARTAYVPAGLPMPQLLEEVRRFVHFSEILGRVSLYWYFFDPAYLFLTGGYANVVNSTRHVGVFVAPLLVLIPAGLVEIATKRRSRVMHLVAAVFLTAPLAACLVVPEPYALDRELVLLPFGVLIATAGVDRLLHSTNLRWRWLTVALLIVVPIHFGFFLYDYFGDYRGRSGFWFNGNHRGAFEEIIAREPTEHPPAVYISTRHDPYMESYWRFSLAKWHRDDLLTRTVYFETLDVKSVPRGSLVVARMDDGLPFTRSAQLRLVSMLPEPGEDPIFVILRR